MMSPTASTGSWHRSKAKWDGGRAEPRCEARSRLLPSSTVRNACAVGASAHSFRSRTSAAAPIRASRSSRSGDRPSMVGRISAMAEAISGRTPGSSLSRRASSRAVCWCAGRTWCLRSTALSCSACRCRSTSRRACRTAVSVVRPDLRPISVTSPARTLSSRSGRSASAPAVKGRSCVLSRASSTAARVSPRAGGGDAWTASARARERS